MRIFEHFNRSNGHVCPICGTNEDKQTVLIPVNGSNKEGDLYTYEAKMYHVECIDLMEYQESFVDGGVLLAMMYVKKRGGGES